ncbi:hypothetical protein ACHAXA_006762 [Cyclostephanos tholiformis]|uniref:[histone H3]-lysine(4) N-trimethyltransferase n=1 Tax=Cyclostephanos tholiformis TaxID=382380 RepID=A0ABD3SRH2_9STRA
MPQQVPSSAPRSTLANLLSSQRRSIAQMDRHRIQIARPFADHSFIEQAARRASLIYSGQSKQNGRDISNQSSQNGSNHGSSSSNSRSTIPVQETRRVTFFSPPDPKSIINTEKVSRKRSRGDTVMPRVESLSCAAPSFVPNGEETNDGVSSVQRKQHDTKSSKSANSEPKSILRKMERSSERKSDKCSQKFIIKEIISEASTTGCHQLIDTTNNTDHKENSLTAIHSNDSGDGASTTNVGLDHVPDANISRMMTADILPKTGTVHLKRDDREMSIGRGHRGHIAQSARVIEVHDPAVVCQMGLKDERSALNSPKSYDEYRCGSAIMQDSEHKIQSSIVPHGEISWQKKKPDAIQKHEDKGLHDSKIPPESASKSNLQDSSADLAVSSALSKKRSKDFSPFRVRVGCVVAVRFRKLADGGNKIVSVVKDGDSFCLTNPPHEISAKLKKSDVVQKDGPADDNIETAPQYNPRQRWESGSSDVTQSSGKERRVGTKRISKPYEIWSPAIPGVDDGLSLLGSWIRCVFPKSFITRWRKENMNGINSSPGRTVEGTVISILGKDNDERNGVSVCILVDRSALKSLPYLQAIPDDSNDIMHSSSERKRRRLEAMIRGENKVVVQVTLASVFHQRIGYKFEPGVVSQWAVRKRVLAKPAGKKPTKEERNQSNQRAQSLFVGDGNDTQFQQEQNWRWIASRATCHDKNLFDGTSRDSLSQLVGEVVKIDVSPPSEGSTTLAWVTIKRLWTPEHIQGGRMAHHGPLELFDSSPENNDELYFQVPIEDLIVIGKRIFRPPDVWSESNIHCALGDAIGCSFTVTHSYQARENIFTPLCKSGMPKKLTSNCIEKFDPSVCYSVARETFIEPTNQNIKSKIGQSFSGLVTFLESTPFRMDFTLPADIGTLSLRPSFSPLTVGMTSKSYTAEPKKQESKNKIIGKGKKRILSDTRTKSEKKSKTMLYDDFPDERGQQVFEPLVARTVAFDQLNKSSWGSSKVVSTSSICELFFREKGRPRAIKIGKNEEKSSLSGRAARANSRRMFKSLAALGDALKNVDRLAGRDREHQLRFDKSRIHGWGVYAEMPINMGDMIIEYRGEIIGNAVADKREKEYENEKMDDYMFRIDSFTVCDATILGNVARYINASCSPNCTTQIITTGENKRIVIYAKRDIYRGEELCYDYKFSYESDQTKRIPCKCGSPVCRGFLN